jgi:hypothetical protein
MTTQPEALRLADRLESDFIRSQTMVDAAAELRRLHAENRVLHERHHDGNVILTQILAQRDALLEALKTADQFITNGMELGFIRMPDAATPDSAHETPGIVRAAIKAVEETK